MVMKRTTYQQCGEERDVSCSKVLSPDPKIHDSQGHIPEQTVYFLDNIMLFNNNQNIQLTQ